jgi:biotin carboxyl carrier protein
MLTGWLNLGSGPEGAFRESKSMFVEVKAAMSGVFYRTPAPGQPPFVEPGTAIRKGQTLALLEAMKLFAKVKAPVGGTVFEIRAAHEETVTSGQTLFVIVSG